MPVVGFCCEFRAIDKMRWKMITNCYYYLLCSARRLNFGFRGWWMRLQIVASSLDFVCCNFSRSIKLHERRAHNTQQLKNSQLTPCSSLAVSRPWQCARHVSLASKRFGFVVVVRRNCLLRRLASSPSSKKQIIADEQSESDLRSS